MTHKLRVSGLKNLRVQIWLVENKISTGLKLPEEFEITLIQKTILW